MIVTVNDLIDALNKIKNKELPIELIANDNDWNLRFPQVLYDYSVYIQHPDEKVIIQVYR